MLASVSQHTGRHFQILEQRGQPADHPVSPSCPENHYLKCVICRVFIIVESQLTVPEAPETSATIHTP